MVSYLPSADSALIKKLATDENTGDENDINSFDEEDCMWLCFSFRLWGEESNNFLRKGKKHEKEIQHFDDNVCSTGDRTAFMRGGYS